MVGPNVCHAREILLRDKRRLAHTASRTAHRWTCGGAERSANRALSLGPIQKHLLVTGDRYWQMTGAGWRPTAVQPFKQMPLTRQRAFGGPDYAANQVGAGHEALRRSRAGELARISHAV
ncbi:DUF2169 domain-containing protein (plasmid) [Bradyrhizobium sp. CCGUVB23]|nr:DUF2169 domain-containing protein [Bradyrhizobium sp. CCGUVB23]MCP3468439.1 DUF2169 domain-containing protein [Bradyrhizobium sp. CCGUVB23]